MTRRKFLDASLKGSLALAGASLLNPSATRAVEPIKRPGKPRLQLALAAYSFRDTFRSKDASKRITMENFVDFCADHNCAAEVTSYFFPEPVTHDYLIKLKRQAFLRGIAISGSAVGNNFALPESDPKRAENIALVKKWVDHCVVLCAPHIRVFAGPTQDKDIGPAKKRCIEALEECGEYAGNHGIFLGLENHGGIVTEPDDLLEIVKAVKSPWVGINLDTGNFHTDDPYADLARCAPYAVNVQVKAEIKRRGQTTKEESDVKRLVKILRDTNYQGFVALEYEAKPDPWKAVPEWLKKLGDALA